MVAQQLILVRVGETDILIEATQVAGSEPTSARIHDAVQYVSDAFNRAQDTIVEVAKSTAQVIEKAAKQAASPDRLEVEFGLRFSATGSIIMAGATGEATLKVILAFDAVSGHRKSHE